MQSSHDVQQAAAALREKLGTAGANPNRVGIILGTGLSRLGDNVKKHPKARIIPFASLPGFPSSGVESHEGVFIIGEICGCPAIIQKGRCHLYEGRTPAQVCMGVRVMAACGVDKLIITNAAGALNPLFDAGSLMLMADQINHTGLSPLTGVNNPAWGERFPDMSRPFDPVLLALAERKALELGMRLELGVYIGVHGPEMETPAETRMYRLLGADAIGMSTVLEVIAARHLGVKVLGISCLTNKNLPDHMEPAPLAQVIRVAEEAGAQLEKLIERVCAELATPGKRN